MEYASWLQVDLCFQSFDKELQTLEKMYAPQNGGIVLCKLEDEFIGCSAIRRIDTDICELKRMWVKPGHQNKGIGVGLLKECIQMAEKLKYKCIRLDTLERLAAAIHLYKKHGFVEAAPIILIRRKKWCIWKRNYKPLHFLLYFLTIFFKLYSR